MIKPNSLKDLEMLISNGVEESIQLEYKSADALQNTDHYKKEIAKDVSSMANSAGGIILYGIKEFGTVEKKHLPEKITPVKRFEISKEWLEQVISNSISPKIDGLRIYPIPLEQSDEVVYMVEVPQSSTAHQNTKDFKYYKRYNFESVAMIDYEIKDIMNRLKYPVIELDFEIEEYIYEEGKDSIYPFNKPITLNKENIEPKKEYKTIYTLKVFPVNKGKVYAKYINYYIEFPDNVISQDKAKYLKKKENSVIEFYGENTFRDIIDVEFKGFNHVTKYGPSRFDPVLPGVRGRSEKIELSGKQFLDEKEITWIVYADNASPAHGSIKLNEIPVIKTGEEPILKII
jgi:hypothetical protein